MNLQELQGFKSFDKVQALRQEILRLEKHMANCKHEFGQSFYNPDVKSRWTRVCVHCGMPEHTYEVEPIIIGEKPKF